MKILFLGFFNTNTECLYGDYKFLRNCGPYAFFSKYICPLNKQNNEKLHKGEIQLAYTNEYEKHRKHFNFEGGPLVGIKSLLYNLDIRNDIDIKISNEITDGFDFYYIHGLNNNLKKVINNNIEMLKNKLIYSPHINKKDYNNNIKCTYWTHSSCNKAPYYLPYPIHKTLYQKYPLEKISNKRNKILIFTKTNSLNKKLGQILLNQEKEIIKFFSKYNYECLSLSYFNKGFRRSELLDYANNSCICLYLSFYDAGALAINEITFMGCYIIGFINNKSKQQVNHSVAPSCIIENETGEYINDFARICDENEKANSNLISGCNKVLDILKNKKLDNVEIAKKNT